MIAPVDVDDVGDADASFSAVDAERRPRRRRDLLKLLAELPDRFRLPIVYVKLEGLSVAEASQRIGHVGVGSEGRRAPRPEGARRLRRTDTR